MALRQEGSVDTLDTMNTLPGNGFSVVTPNLNMGHLLAETMDSVLSNLRPGDQYFVMDGGSSDNSVEILKQYSSRLTGWASEPDEGYGAAIEKGFRCCSGDFFCWINSGDLLLPGALDIARAELTRTRADLIFGDDYYFDDHGAVISRTWGGVSNLKNMMLYGGWTPLQDACFWRKRLHDRIGGLNSRIRVACDFDFFLRASIHGICRYVPKAFSAFRCHQNQKSVLQGARYEAEREEVRKRVLASMNISTDTRRVLESYYWFVVRWRHYVSGRFRQSTSKRGKPLQSLFAQ